MRPCIPGSLKPWLAFLFGLFLAMTQAPAQTRLPARALHKNRFTAIEKVARKQPSVFDSVSGQESYKSLSALKLTDDLLGKDYISHLCQGISFKTISEENDPLANQAEFTGFQNFLSTTYPLADTVLQRQVMAQNSLLYKWRGRNPRLEPVLFIAHMDVVPVDPGSEKKWLEPAFSGKCEGGYIWGRGSLDDKVSILSIMEAVEDLIKSGYEPNRDIYFAFGADEECFGNGAASISTYFKENNIHFQFILDEGGGILDSVIPYVQRPVAFIGIAEKGYVSLELTANDPGGHSSLPIDEGVVGILGKAIYRLQEKPFPTRLTMPVKEMFRELGKNMVGINGFVAMHPLFFSDLLKKEMSTHPITNALIQTTLAPTIFEGGNKDNVMPSTARMVINLRILPGESVQTAISRVKRTIHDKRINLRVVSEEWNPSKIANIKSKSYKILRHTIENVFPNTAVAPNLNVSISDSRHYAKLSNNILHFVPIVMKEGDAERIHGINERLSASNYKDCIRFYYHFILNADMQL